MSPVRRKEATNLFASMLLLIHYIPDVCGLLGHHHLHEFFVVDLPITVYVRLTNHLINLFVRKLKFKLA